MMSIIQISVYAMPGVPKEPNDIARRVIKNVFKIEPDTMLQKTRKTEVRFPRQLAVTLIFCSGVSCSKTGWMYRIDHATVLHSKDKITEILETKFPKEDYNKVISAIQEYKTYFPNIDLTDLPGPWNEEILSLEQ